LLCFCWFPQIKKDKVTVDIITDATIYPVNNSFLKLRLWQLMGKIVAIGTNSEISKQYESKNTIDGRREIYLPLFQLMRTAIFYSYGFSFHEAGFTRVPKVDEIITRFS
jgi:hypothetical protein